MSIARWKPTETPRDLPKEHSVVEEPRRHEIYDHRTTPLWSLDAFLEGSPWEVTLLTQRLGVNDVPRKLDINLPASLQSYNRYEKFEIIVENQLASAYNTERHEFTVNGVAVVPSFIQPNVEDVFYAIANMGRLGLFAIKRVERITYERESAYRIEYEMRKEMTGDDPEFQNLQQKTVEPVFVYSKQRLIENKNPILVKETYQDVVNLQQDYRRLVDYYFRTFLTPYESCFIIPGQNAKIYDPYLSNHLLTFVSPWDTDAFPKMAMLSINQDDNYRLPTIWSAMRERGESSMQEVVRYMGRIRPSSFPQAYFGRSATYGNVDYMLYPLEIDTSMNSQRQRSYRWYSVPDVLRCVRAEPIDLQPTGRARHKEFNPYDHLHEVGTREVMVYDFVLNDLSYIFSEGFYEGQPNNLLEISVWDYLRRSTISMIYLKKLIHLYMDLPRLEQFYYGPFLFALIKEADRRAYT